MGGETFDNNVLELYELYQQKDFDKLWKDLLQFCKEKDYIFGKGGGSIVAEKLNFIFFPDSAYR